MFGIQISKIESKLVIYVEGHQTPDQDYQEYRHKQEGIKSKIRKYQLTNHELIII